MALCLRLERGVSLLGAHSVVMQYEGEATKNKQPLAIPGIAEN